MSSFSTLVYDITSFPTTEQTHIRYCFRFKNTAFIRSMLGRWCSGWRCQFGKSEIAGSNPILTFKFRRSKVFISAHSLKNNNVGRLRDREVAWSASDRQEWSFESCVWKTVLSHSSHHPQEVFLAQFSLYVHKSGLKPHSFHFIVISSIFDSYPSKHP